MEKQRIEKEMRELAKLIQFPTTNITLLSQAMGSIKDGSEYKNEGLATVGDAMLKSVIADKLFSDGIKTKGDITKKKSSLENNETLHNIMINEGLIKYSYNDLHFYGDDNIPDHEKVVCKEHDPYIEAMVGAVYYSTSYKTTREWILNWLMPLIEKYKVDN